MNKRYIYIVTRTSENLPRGVTNYPTLGMHTSEKRANEHFTSIIEERKKRGCRISWDVYNHLPEDKRFLILRRSEILSGLAEVVNHLREEREELILERWTVLKRR